MFWKLDETMLKKPAELAAEMAAGAAPVIVDVRGPEEFRAGHLPGAVNIPLAELERRKNELDPAEPTVFY
jgi:phage shock protein E